MKIQTFKKNKDGSYTLHLENEEDITLYEEVILKYELLLSRTIDAKKRQAILEENAFWQTYYEALRLLRIKARTKEEVKEALLKKGYLKSQIIKVQEKLEEQNYLDDKRYANSYVNMQLRTTSWGPSKISSALSKKGISKEDMEDALSLFTKELEEEKITKIVNKMVRANHRKSTSSLKQTIKGQLFREGYDSLLVQKVLATTNFESDEALREREYEKLKRTLARKYQGEELERQIERRLYQKGFTR